VCLKRAGAGEYLKTWGRRNFLLDLLIDRLRRLPTFIITLQAESSIIHPRSYLTADYNGDNGSRMATTPDAPSSQRFHIFFFSSYSFFFPPSLLFPEIYDEGICICAHDTDTNLYIYLSIPFSYLSAAATPGRPDC
jgi:hypothetical protein